MNDVPEQRDDRQPASGSTARRLAIVASIVLFLGIMFLLGDFRSGMPGSGLFDPDTYARLLRIERLLAGGGWYDNTVPWANAPYDGPTLHWTRPLDAIVAIGAIPLSRVMPLRAAIVRAGSVVPVILGVVTLLALLWAARRLLGPKGLVLVGFLVAAQPTLPHIFKYSYVDHHCLIAALFAIGWAGAIRALEGSARAATISGIAAGLSLWVTIESIGWILLAAGAVSLLWIRENERDHVAVIARYFVATAITSAVALVLERPPSDLLSMEMDRISLPYVAIVVAMAVSWIAVGRWAGRNPPTSGARRFGITFAGFAAPLAAAIAIFPKILRGPVADVDPRVLPLLFEGNAEFSHFHTGDLLYLGTLAGAIGPTLIATVWAMIKVRSDDRDAARLSILTLVFVAVFLPLTLYQWRWAIYLNVVATIPWALAIRSVLRAPEGARSMRRWLAVPLAIALATAHFVVAVGFARANLAKTRRMQRIAQASPGSKPLPRRTAGLSRVQCSYAGLGNVLAGLSHRKPSDLIVMTTMYDGPQMAFQAGTRVVGSPYHRNGTGIMDTDTVMAGPDEKAARRVLDTRGVDYLAICATGTTASVMLENAPEGLVARLVRGDIPPWLRPVPLPRSLDRGLGVYRVVHGSPNR